MNSEEGKIWFGIGVDTSALEKGVQRSKKAFTDLEKSCSSECAKLDKAFDKVAKAAASIGITISAWEFANKVAEVRGEFQKLEVAFKTMLGSAEKADALMQQLVRTAATTPFDLQGVASGAKHKPT